MKKYLLLFSLFLLTGCAREEEETADDYFELSYIRGTSESLPARHISNGDVLFVAVGDSLYLSLTTFKSMDQLYLMVDDSTDVTFPLSGSGKYKVNTEKAGINYIDVTGSLLLLNKSYTIKCQIKIRPKAASDVSEVN